MGDQLTIGETTGYLALPEQGRGPGVLLLHSWWGLDPRIKRIADQLAAEGYVALAPDLYHGPSTDDVAEGRRLMSELPPERAAADIVAAARVIAAHPACCRPIGSLGFGLGGRLALWAGTLADEITAAAAFYPALPDHELEVDWSSYAHKQAIIHTCDEDGGADAPVVRAAIQGIEAAGGSVVAHDYPGSKHSFCNEKLTEVYDEIQADEAWGRTIDFLVASLQAT